MKTRRRFSPAVYAGIVLRQKGRCACGCGEPLGDDPREIQFDHVHDLQFGGADTPDNLRALIKKHHLEKTVANHKQAAKLDRIAARDGLHKRKMSAKDKAMQKMIERRTA
jgi:5-methylcytosine-specific restriction endonuclease McrA